MNELDIPDWLSAGIAGGVGATLVIDLWAQLLRRAAGIGSTDWALVGRWVAGLGRGQLQLRGADFDHRQRGDALRGWLTHYAVGIAYALIYLALVNAFASRVSLLSALLFGAVTVLAPWLILQPALGKGLFASTAPKPGQTRLLNLVTHLLFGAGLYLCCYFSSQLNP